MLHIILCSRLDIDDDADDDFNRDNESHAPNDDDNHDDDNNNDDHDDDDDDDDDALADARDTFDLQCDDDPADRFFASEAFNNAVALLDEEPERPRQQPEQPRLPRVSANDDNDPPPQKPDLSSLEAEDAARAMKAWRVDRKRWTDRRARLRRNERIGNGDLLVYTGDASPLLRLMTVVQQRRLMVGDSFENKDTLRMRIAEEANLANKEISTVRSDTMQLVVVGVDFYVKANNTERRGWVVSSAICRNGDGEMPNNAATQKIRYLGRQCDTNTIDLSRSDDDDDDDGGMYHVSAVMYVLLCNMSALTILSCTVVCSLTVLT